MRFCKFRFPTLAISLAVFGFAGHALDCRGQELGEAGLLVQVDREGLTAEDCRKYVVQMRAAGAQGVELVFCEFYPDGEVRKAELQKLSGALKIFREAGFATAVWTTSLGWGKMTDRDYLRRFPGFRPLRSFDGKEEAVCTTDARNREVVAENLRDFIRAGADFILFDDDLVQACRPGVGCVCDEHLRRTARRLGRPQLTAADVKQAFTGSSNAVRTAYLDVLGESLTDFCRQMRATADEIDPSVNIGLCASVSHYDLDGVHLGDLVRTLAAKGKRPFLRVSGATYWPLPRWGQSRYPGQDLGGVFEFVRTQTARYRKTDIVLADENDTYPRDSSFVSPAMCELYDRMMVAEGGMIRNKYVLRRNVANGSGVDPSYLAAHLKGAARVREIASAFAGARPYGFRVFAPEHLLRGATLPAAYPGDSAMITFFTQPMAGVLLTMNGAPTQYERDDLPFAAFGPAARLLPAAALDRGVLLDAEGARQLSASGVDLGLSRPPCRVVGEWVFRENACGRRFVISGKTQYEMDYRQEAARTLPVDDIWRFLAKADLAVRAETPGAYLLAKERANGAVVALVANVRDRPMETVSVRTSDGVRMMALAPWDSACFTIDCSAAKTTK